MKTHAPATLVHLYTSNKAEDRGCIGRLSRVDRRGAVVRLALVDATLPQIATVPGHRPARSRPFSLPITPAVMEAGRDCDHDARHANKTANGVPVVLRSKR